MVGALTAVVITAAWCWLLRWLGPTLGFVEQPGEDDLKVHTIAAVPLAGPGLLLGLATGLVIETGTDLAYLIGLVVLTGLGVIDDRFQLTPGVRLLVEALAAASIGAVWWETGPAVAIGAAAAVVLAVNAVNLYDGIDMLAPYTAVVTLLTTGAVSLAIGADPWLPFLLAAALAGFLPFNWHPARVFLGDGGAYLVGGAIAISLWDVGVTAGGWTPIAALGLLGMFAVDLVVTLLRRLRAGQPLFAGDRGHLYDLMVAAGSSVPNVVTRLVAAHAIVIVVVAVILVFVGPGQSVVAVAAIGLVAVGIAWSVASRLSRSGERRARPGR